MEAHGPCWTLRGASKLLAEAKGRKEQIPPLIAELLVGGIWGSWVTCTGLLCDPKPQASLLIYLGG